MGKKAEYGAGHPDFLTYVRFIVDHPNYAGMPDLLKDDGQVQWEAPSNRASGKFQHTYQKRLDWWRAKATVLGITVDSPQWISRTAKRLHPTKRKPCKRCGRVLEISYVYPSKTLMARLARLPFIDESFERDEFEDIFTLLGRLAERFGDVIFGHLPYLLGTGAFKGEAAPPSSVDLIEWTHWLRQTYVPSEPRLLSPGAMANPPDRLDGFHSFNRCCRSTADTGRTTENLRSYTTDRRVFEYWVEGDWIAADRLMAQVGADEMLRAQPCANGHLGPCSADHIGPISLGFSHRPEFRLLCQPCNSSRNNRMTFADVTHLVEREAAGEQVVSWYCKALWDATKGNVTDDETALRLVKMMRDNRHTVMLVLNNVLSAGHATFLATYLNLECADLDVAFENLRVENHVTRFDKLTHTKRTSKQATKQKGRRLRVGLGALRDYMEKSGRNALNCLTEQAATEVAAALVVLQQDSATLCDLDRDIISTVFASGAPNETNLSKLSQQIPGRQQEPPAFKIARSHLDRAVTLVAQQLSTEWESDRYVRAVFEEGSDEGDLKTSTQEPISPGQLALSDEI